MPFVLADKIPPFLRGRLGLALFALAGTTATLITAWALHGADRTLNAQDFERRQNLRQAFLQQSLGEYENSLFALRLVAENNASFNPTEFERAAHDVYSRSPGIQSIQWAPVLSSSEVPGFVERMRRLVYPNFVIRQRQADGAIVTPDHAVARDEINGLAVISYLYPQAGNEMALGYDIHTAPSAAEQQRARRTLSPSLTRPFELIQGYTGIIFLCYARRGSTEEGPPFAGAGYVQLVLNLHQVMQNLWNRSPSNIADFSIYDATGPEPIPLYTQLASKTTGEPVAMRWVDFHTPDTLSRDWLLGGRIWRACYRPSESWRATRGPGSTGLVLGGGLLLTLMGVAYLRLLLRRTERIRREVGERTAELSESRAFLDTVIRQSPSSIWVKDLQLRFRLVNGEFCRAHGRAMSELLGQTDALLFPPDAVAEMEKVDREVIASGQTRHFECTYPMRDVPRTYLVAKFPLHNSTGEIHAIAGVATDITERHLAQTERATIERRLLESQKLESLGVLAGGIAHDFNNLLTGVLGHASLCRAQLPATAPQQASLVQIEQAARRAAELCQQMLAYAGQGRFALEIVDLGTLVREILPLLRLSASKRARFHFDFPPGLPAVQADRAQMRQLVMNLVMNASESFGDAEGDITLRTSLVALDAAGLAACVHGPDRKPGKYLCLEVIDTGCGMTADTLPKVFDPFFTTKFTGRGLGLAASLGIALGHRGALRVSSTPGQGSTFYLYLPATAAPAPLEPPKPARLASRPPLRAQAATRRLLLVDDEASVRDTASAILTSLGYETEAHADGAEALAAFRGSPMRIHGAILDLTMPGLSGPALLAALREHQPDLPILLMSGYSESEVADLLTAPHTAFLSKPFSIASLQAKLSALLPLA